MQSFDSSKSSERFPMIVSHLFENVRGEDVNSLLRDLDLVQTTFPLLLPDRNLLRLLLGSSSAKGVKTLCWSRTDHELAKFLRVPEAVISWEENRSRGGERFRAARCGLGAAGAG